MLRVLHTIAGLHPSSGGPARTVTSLVNQLEKIDDISVVLATQKHFGDKIYLGDLSGEKVVTADSNSIMSIKAGFPLYKILPDLASNFCPEIIHDHGIWLPVNHIVAKLAAKHNIMRVVHTRGMLEPMALSFRASKKKIAWKIYQERNLESAALFFATSQVEADNLRKLDFAQPIAVIPNGVDMTDVDLLFNNRQLGERERNVVFMGRIHPIKGLKGLLEAWARLGPGNWRLILAGPDENGHLQEVLAYAKKLQIDNQVTYSGVVEGEEKAKLLQSADLFILPSFSENFGVVVAEALAYGVPVISTFGTPWRGLVENKCGWWVDAQPDALGRALSEAVTLSDEERYEMGVRGRQYARQFDWGQIARETSDVYHWLLGKADRPDCVRLN